jgi:putative nucleotidyltransferase with HDIG domain
VDDLELLSTLASQAGIAIENAGLYNDLVQVYFDTIKSLASALEAKDIYTHGHSRRVAKDAVRIARRLGLGKRQLEMIRHGALLHDIGKIGIRDSILFKPGPLDAEERQHIRSHPVMGATIMASFDVLKDVRDIIKYHHERWDGAGFPDGLSGAEIPLGARIVCIADSFDAMITSRPYREGMPIPRALEILRAERGKQFDPELVDVFVDVIQSIHPALQAARS